MFQKIKGNARGCLIFEPMWVITFSMFNTYASVYMLELGLSNNEIGLLTSLNLILQIFTSFISGHLTDRMGRRRALMYFDILSWGVATFLWAISQNFWYFFIAAVVNSFQKIPNTAWNCLLVEDTPPGDRPQIFTILQLISIVAGFFAPLGGLLVNKFTLIPAMRIMYAIACVSMMIMFFGRNRATHDTEISKRKMKESKKIKTLDSMSEYLGVFKEILSDKPLLLIFAIYILNNFQMTVKGTFGSIFMVKALKIDDSLIAVFPTVASIANLVVLIAILPRLKIENSVKYMITGFALSFVSNLILILSPINGIAAVTVSTILAAVGTIVVSPYLESAVANSISDENRAKSFSILTVLILLFTSPSGIIGGFTYSIDPKIPFILVMAAFMISILLLFIFVRIKKPTETAS